MPQVLGHAALKNEEVDQTEEWWAAKQSSLSKNTKLPEVEWCLSVLSSEFLSVGVFRRFFAELS